MISGGGRRTGIAIIPPHRRVCLPSFQSNRSSLTPRTTIPYLTIYTSREDHDPVNPVLSSTSSTTPRQYDDCDIYDLFLLMMAGSRTSSHPHRTYSKLISFNRIAWMNEWLCVCVLGGRRTISSSQANPKVPDDMQISLIGDVENECNAINNILRKNL